MADTAVLPTRTATGGNPSRVGELLQLLRDEGPLTRSAIAFATGLPRSTIATRIDALVASGFVQAAGEASSSGGRPASRFTFNPRARVVFAIDVGATHVVLALTDLDGNVLAERRESIAITTGPASVLGLILRVADAIMADSGHSESELAGIGIGLPGPVEHDTGRPVKPPIMPGWDDFDVVGYIQARFNTPVLVDNDVNIMALGEGNLYWSGVKNLIFIKVATGIGAGIISNGELQRGADGIAGDLGHIRVDRAEDVLCRCGNRGCLEAIASGPAMARSLRSLGHDATSNSDVIELAEKGNGDAIQVIRRAGRDIGEVLATAVNLLNPSVIVIGGSYAQVGEHLMAGVREVVYTRSLPRATSNLTIALSLAGSEAAVLGASQLVTRHILSPAVIESTLFAAD
jgi:predicted NBD/HSP70 family sugar kinase